MGPTSDPCTPSIPFNRWFLCFSLGLLLSSCVNVDVVLEVRISGVGGDVLVRWGPWHNRADGRFRVVTGGPIGAKAGHRHDDPRGSMSSLVAISDTFSDSCPNDPVATAQTPAVPGCRCPRCCAGRVDTPLLPDHSECPSARSPCCSRQVSQCRSPRAGAACCCNGQLGRSSQGQQGQGCWGKHGRSNNPPFHSQLRTSPFIIPSNLHPGPSTPCRPRSAASYPRAGWGRGCSRRPSYW